MSRYFLGIDPGMSGGIGVIDRDGAFVMAEAMPIIANAAGKRMVDTNELGRLVRHYTGEVLAAIEEVSAMPGQGVTSMFSFGSSFGAAMGVLGGLGIGFELVRPQKWKKLFSLTSDKEVSRGFAIRRWPDAPLARKKDEALAEALLIAEWLRNTRGTRFAPSAGAPHDLVIYGSNRGCSV